MGENSEIYTLELKNVLSYMTDILVNEFPTNVFTPEYLIVSILDTKNCHANLILDNCLMSNNLEELKEIYISALEKHLNPNVKIEKDPSKVKYNQELTKIIDKAKNEVMKTNAEKIGTEHILLSILNPANEIGIEKVLKTVGLNYSFILNKCTEQKPSIESSPSNILPAKQGRNLLKPNFTALKNEVNTIASANKNMFISQYTININNLAKNGKVEKLVGRKKEINEIIKVFARRKKNNAVIVGNGGVGKTQLVYGLAHMIVSGDVPPFLENKEIVKLNAMALVSGTNFRGMFEERVKGLFDELQASDKYILFLDDIQTVLKSGSKDKDADISNMIGNILTEGNVRVIGTTTFKEYRNAIESNTQISRKFQKIIVEPLTIEESIDVLSHNKVYYENFHNVVYSDSIIRKIVELSTRYITDRCLPDSAIDVMDLAGANARLLNKEPEEIKLEKKRLVVIEGEKEEAMNNGNFEKLEDLTNEENVIKKDIVEYKRSLKINNNPKTIIDENIVSSTISEMTGIPISRLSINEKEKIAHIDDILKESVIGQDEAIEAICGVIKRNKVGLGDKTKTIANVLELGPSGCGKTLIAKKLAEEIFGDEKALVRIDMSEYSEKNSVAKLTGAAPGYIGYDNGGQLTEAIKNKQHCVLLLDEIEKADQEVYNLFLQLFDEGRLTDSAGQVVNFKNVIVLMTSNIGARQAAEFGGGIGFATDEEANKKSIIEKELKKKFSPEFLNRIDKIVYFNNLTDENLKTIVRLEIDKLAKRIDELGYGFHYEDNLVDYIHSKAIKEKEFGARPIIRLVQNIIEDKITDILLENNYEKGYIFNAKYDGKDVLIS